MTAVKIREDKNAAKKRFFGTGRRKTSVARIQITPGDGTVVVNQRLFDEYFPLESLRMIIMQPMDSTGNLGKFDIRVNVKGGGISGQAGAVRHAMARALLSLNPDYRKPLNRGGYLTRDDRVIK